MVAGLSAEDSVIRVGKERIHLSIEVFETPQHHMLWCLYKRAVVVVMVTRDNQHFVRFDCAASRHTHASTDYCDYLPLLIVPSLL